MAMSSQALATLVEAGVVPVGGRPIICGCHLRDCARIRQARCKTCVFRQQHRTRYPAPRYPALLPVLGILRARAAGDPVVHRTLLTFLGALSTSDAGCRMLGSCSGLKATLAAFMQGAAGWRCTNASRGVIVA